MNRRDTKADLLALLKKLREKVPGLVLRTSLIAGLPYEDDAAFEELCDFLRQTRIERAGVFPFSPEDGTKAALMEHVDTEEAQRRAELAVDVQSDIIDAYNDSILGEERRSSARGTILRFRCSTDAAMLSPPTLTDGSGSPPTARSLPAAL